MKFNKYGLMIVTSIGLLLSGCGEDKTVDKVSAEDNNDAIEVNKPIEEIVEVEEIIDPIPANDLSAEVDIEMMDLNFILVDFQKNLNEYYYNIVNYKLEDYQKKVLLDSGELVNEKIKSIKLDAITEGDKEILYLFDELKKYHEIRFNALKTYLDNPNDTDFKLFNDNSIIASDIAMKMIDIRAKDLE